MTAAYVVTLSGKHIKFSDGDLEELRNELRLDVVTATDPWAGRDPPGLQHDALLPARADPALHQD
jgi:hypothetical protein